MWMYQRVHIYIYAYTYFYMYICVQKCMKTVMYIMFAGLYIYSCICLIFSSSSSFYIFHGNLLRPGEAYMRQ